MAVDDASQDRRDRCSRERPVGRLVLEQHPIRRYRLIG